MKQKIINPSTGETITEVDVWSKEEVKQALNTARNSFDSGPWRNFSLAERKKALLNISKGILDKAGELATLESQNTGKPIKESTFMDIPSGAKTFEYFAYNLERFLEEDKLDIASEISSAQSRLLREPRGVTVLIVPWNYPFLIACWKMAQSLAAGNTVILKPSSLTPLTALELGKIVLEAGLPQGVVNIVCGRGDAIGEKLCSDKRVDMISFTGSNSVGQEIIGYCSKNVKKLIAELGGKSASIVLADCDLEEAINGSLCSIFLNQGQMCTAMSRIFVQAEIYDKFIAGFVDRAKRIKLGDSLDYQTQMGPLVSGQQRDKVMSFVEKAKAQKANLLCGGKIPNTEELRKGFFFEPAVFTQVSPDTAVFQEEIFGPVVCINRFSDIEEAVRLTNISDFALAGCIWTKDTVKAQKLAAQINAGTIWINTYGMFFNEVPYGGFKQSGFGKELGKDGFLEYSRLKNIIIDATKDSKTLVNYWYGF